MSESEDELDFATAAIVASANGGNNFGATATVAAAVAQTSDKEEEGGGSDNTQQERTTVSVEKTKKKKKKKERSRVRIGTMTPEELATFNEEQRKRGVIYLSRVPPYMKPAKLKHILSKYGQVDRLFLQQEDPAVRARRKKQGGNKKLKYTEGWVEFLDKRVARRLAQALNGTIMGGKKSSYYHDDLWSMRYLPRFKWHHLTDKTAYDRAVRDKRLAAEMAQVRRETDQFVAQASKAARIKHARAAKGKEFVVPEGEREWLVDQRTPIVAGVGGGSGSGSGSGDGSGRGRGSGSGRGSFMLGRRKQSTGEEASESNWASKKKRKRPSL